MEKVIDIANRLLPTPATGAVKDSEAATTKRSHVGPSAVATKKNSTEFLMKRRVVLSKLIDRLYACDKNQGPPDDDLLTELANSWDEHLTRAGVPTSRFNDVYLEAVQLYDRKGPFGIFDMLAGWQSLQARETTPRDEKPPCPWEHINEEKDVEGVLVGSAETVILPCPECLPEEHYRARNEGGKPGPRAA